MADMAAADAGAPIEELPDELLAAIFAALDPRSLLVVLPLVCCRWRQICGTLRQVNFDTSFAPQGARFRTDPRLLLPALRRFAEVTTLVLRGSAVTDVLLHAIAKICPRLVSIDLAKTGRLQGLSQSDFGKRPGPELLQASDPEPAELKLLTHGGVLAFAAACPKLESIDLSQVWCIDQGFLVKLAKTRPRLKRLQAAFTTGADSFAEITSHLPLLTHIGLGEVNNSSVIEMARHCPHLQSVSLSIYELTEDAVRALVDRPSGLISLRLSRALGLNDGGMRLVAAHCPRLTTLALTTAPEITDAGVADVASACPLLTEVELEKCDGLTAASAVVLAERCAKLATVNFNRTEEITGVGVIALAQQCPHLTAVSIGMCSGVTDATVCALAKGGLLTRFVAFRCNGLTDASLIALADACPGLVEVNFTDTQVTDRGVMTLAEKCPALSDVTFSVCSQLTNDAVSALVEHCPNLHRAYFLTCPKMDKAQLLEKHPQIAKRDFGLSSGSTKYFSNVI